MMISTAIGIVQLNLGLLALIYVDNTFFRPCLNLFLHERNIITLKYFNAFINISFLIELLSEKSLNGSFFSINYLNKCFFES